MQTLWARAAQTRCTCKCAFCHSTTALSRKTTSSALKRRLRFRDIFTVFYSTLLASAAVVDSCHKDARRRKWEMAIKEAREELTAIEDQQRGRIAYLSLTSHEGGNMTSREKNTWDNVFEMTAEESRERELLGFQGLKGPSLSVLKELSIHEIIQLLKDPAIVRLNTYRDSDSALWVRPIRYHPLAVKKIKTLEWSVRKLAYRLLLSCKEGDSQTQAEESGDEAGQLQPDVTTKEYILGRIEKCEQALHFIGSRPRDPILWERMQSPRIPAYSRKVAHQAASLNDQLLELFRSYKTSNARIDSLLTSICSLLLHSPSPPDVHFYNTLIIHLCRLRRMADVEAVLDSMRECHIRPNEITLSVTLHHYTATRDWVGFNNFAKRMKGARNGLFLEHPNAKIAPGLRERYKIRENYSREKTVINDDDEELLYESRGYSYSTPDGSYPLERGSSKKIIGTARINMMDLVVYGALIRGFLSFWRPRLAMRYYRQMISDGFKPNLTILRSILNHCAKSKDWDAGVAVWKQICSLAEGADRLALVFMLELCHSCGKLMEFDQVLDYGVRIQLIPPITWEFPKRNARGLTHNLLQAADMVASARQRYLRISISRYFLERAVELQAHQIASTALAFSTIEMEARQRNVGFKIYLKSNQQHRNSPAATTYKGKEMTFRRLARRVGADIQRQADRAPHSVALDVPIKVLIRRTTSVKGRLITKVRGQLLIKKAKGQLIKKGQEQLIKNVKGQLIKRAKGQLTKKAKGQLFKKVNKQLIRKVQGQLIRKVQEQLFKKVKGQLIKKAKGQLVRKVKERLIKKAKGQLFKKAKGQLIKKVQGQLIKRVTSGSKQLIRKPIPVRVQLIKKITSGSKQLIRKLTSIRGQGNPSRFALRSTQSTYEDQRAQTQMMKKHSTQPYTAIREQALKPQQRHDKLSTFALGATEFLLLSPKATAPVMRQLTQPFTALEEQILDHQPRSPSDISVTALLEQSNGVKVPPDEEKAQKPFRKEQLIPRLIAAKEHSSQSRQGVAWRKVEEAEKARIPAKKEERETLWLRGRLLEGHVSKSQQQSFVDPSLNILCGPCDDIVLGENEAEEPVPAEKLFRKHPLGGHASNHQRQSPFELSAKVLPEQCFATGLSIEDQKAQEPVQGKPLVRKHPPEVQFPNFHQNYSSYVIHKVLIDDCDHIVVGEEEAEEPIPEKYLFRKLPFESNCSKSPQQAPWRTGMPLIPGEEAPEAVKKRPLIRKHTALGERSLNFQQQAPSEWRVTPNAHELILGRTNDRVGLRA